MPVRDSSSKQGKAVGSGTRRPTDDRAGGAPAAGAADHAAGEHGGASTARKLSLWGFGAVLTVVLLVGVGIAASAAVKAYTRAERRYDAENQVALTHIAISRAQQQALITRAQIVATQADADKRFAEILNKRNAVAPISSTRRFRRRRRLPPPGGTTRSSTSPRGATAFRLFRIPRT